MATTKEIKAAWATRLAKVNGAFARGAAVQIRVEQDDLRQVLGEGVPEGLEDLQAASGSERRPTHVLLWREQLQQLIDYDPRKKPAHDSANVPGQ